MANFQVPRWDVKIGQLPSRAADLAEYRFPRHAPVADCWSQLMQQLQLTSGRLSKSSGMPIGETFFWALVECMQFRYTNVRKEEHPKGLSEEEVRGHFALQLRKHLRYLVAQRLFRVALGKSGLESRAALEALAGFDGPQWTLYCPEVIEEALVVLHNVSQLNCW